MVMSETLEVVVHQRRHEAEGILCLELHPVHTDSLPAFTAGAHIDVHIPVVEMVRQYSLVNDPRETNRYVIAVQLDPESRGGSVGIHHYVQEGQRLQISVPRNHFELVDAPDLMLIAGGIGITPLLAMAQQLHQQNTNFNLHYVARSQARMAFYEVLRASPFADKVHFYFSDDPEGALSVPQLLQSVSTTTHVDVCGPNSLIQAVSEQASENQIEPERVHREYFHNEVVLDQGAASFEVRIASSGQCFTVEADQTISQVLEANGVFVPVSCEEGVCGTCLTSVLEGEINHQDVYLTDEEKAANNQMAVCCSRARSAYLVLDL